MGGYVVAYLQKTKQFIYTLAPKTSLRIPALTLRRGWYLQPEMGIVTDGATTRSFIDSLHAERGRQDARPVEVLVTRGSATLSYRGGRYCVRR